MAISAFKREASHLDDNEVYFRRSIKSVIFDKYVLADKKRNFISDNAKSYFDKSRRVGMTMLNDIGENYF